MDIRVFVNQVMNLDTAIAVFVRLAPLLATVVVSAVVLVVVNRALRRQWAADPEAQYRFQMIMLSLTLASVIAVVLALPIEDSLRAQLLGLLGLLFSAAIALSSTTFIGNILAGFMLKAIKSARPGDFVTVADLTGRITKMDLLHTEIQTELRDLVTVPNLYLVTQPIKVVRASGSVITAEVSLGYDVSRTDVVELLCRAAGESGLRDPFVHVRELGDFSILYRVGGLLEDIDSLISARSRLRESMIDTLHAAKIEIASPVIESARSYPADKQFIPKRSRKSKEPEQPEIEALVFDKATEAASLEDIKMSIEAIVAELASLAEDPNPQNDKMIARLEAQKARLLEGIEVEQKRLEEAERTDKR